MLKSLYLTKYKQLKKENKITKEQCYFVTTTAHSPLSPSLDLLQRYKNKEIDWEGYVKEYNAFLLKVVNKPIVFKKAFDLLREIRERMETEEIYVVCYEADDTYCHRRLIIEFLEQSFDGLVSERQCCC